MAITKIPLFTSQQVRTRQGVVTQYTDADWKGMMVQPARTNLLTYSEEFDNAAWMKQASVDVNQASSPANTQTAEVLSQVSADDYHQIYQQRDVTAGDIYTFSVYAKKGSYNYLRLRFAQEEKVAIFNVSDGSIQTALSGVSTRIIEMGDGWYRCSATYTIGTSQNLSFCIGVSSAEAVTTGSADNYIYIWGAQLEEGSFPSSYIPTEATTVTRPATVAEFNSVGRIRAQNCAVWGRVVPSAGGQDGGFLFKTGETSSGLDILTSATTLRLRKGFGQAEALPTYIHSADTPFEYRAFWSDQGMAIQFKEDGGAWSAWATNPNADPAPIATTFEVGGRTGANQFAGTYPWLATAYLPSLPTLADYQNWIETNTQWNVVGG